MALLQCRLLSGFDAYAAERCIRLYGIPKYLLIIFRTRGRNLQVYLVLFVSHQRSLGQNNYDRVYVEPNRVMFSAADSDTFPPLSRITSPASFFQPASPEKPIPELNFGKRRKRIGVSGSTSFRIVAKPSPTPLEV